ncbi:nitroreductase A, NADPH-dependent, FMN-dependent (fragment) [Shewanella benthica]|uniref:Nitroreductase A, NADPH-dependent, FMN-dependent n=1 Tax=Shewanella benthica TaxID=43661 RepID=A0A330M923_9GAMM
MNSGKQYQKGPLAQLVEQLAFNQLVEGSNPSRPTTFWWSPLTLVQIDFPF